MITADWIIEQRKRMPDVRPDQRSGWHSWQVVYGRDGEPKRYFTAESARLIAARMTRLRGGSENVQHRVRHSPK